MPPMSPTSHTYPHSSSPAATGSTAKETEEKSRHCRGTYSQNWEGSLKSASSIDPFYRKTHWGLQKRGKEVQVGSKRSLEAQTPDYLARNTLSHSAGWLRWFPSLSESRERPQVRRLDTVRTAHSAVPRPANSDARWIGQVGLAHTASDIDPVRSEVRC